jgi:predicted DNA-binding WGR domain protein
MEPQNITLFNFNERKNIDKVYTIDIAQDDQGKWAVTGFYGRRGYPQKAFEVIRTKDVSKALGAYNDRIKAKMAKGYTTQAPPTDPLMLTH